MKYLVSYGQINKSLFAFCLAFLIFLKAGPSLAIPILINEVDADQAGTDDAEFVELYDGGIGNMSLNDFALVFYNGSDDSSYLAFDLDGYSTNGDGYFVLCGDAANVANCDLDVAPDTNLIQNGPDAIALYFGDDIDFLNDTPLTTDYLVDAIVYDTNDDDDLGLLALHNSGQPQVNEGGRNGSATDSNQRCGSGYVQATPTPGAANSCSPSQPISVLINEVDADQAGTDDAEFVELYDGGVGNMSLNDLALVFYNGSDDSSYLAFDLDGYSTNGDGYFVLCGDAANVANCDLDVFPDTNLMQNGPDAIALYFGDDTDFLNDTPLTTDYLIDAIVYDTNDANDLGLLALLNFGQPQVNEGGSNGSITDSNQRCGPGIARNTSGYIQATPTPGAANSCQLISAVPLPTSLPLFAGALGLAGFVSWRKRRRA